MSHVTYTSQSTTVGSAQTASEAEHAAMVSVRKMLEAYAEREVQRVRWSAVIAGLFLSLGSEILLGSLGHAVNASASASANDASQILSRFSSSAGLYSALTALFSTFVGGFAAAKLGGAIRRSDGVLSGILTWATSVVLGLWIVLPALSTSSFLQAVNRAGLHGDAVKAAWFIFGGVALSLLAAIAGGAAGSVGRGSSRGSQGARRREMQSQAAEIQAEIEQYRREKEQGR